MPDENSDFVERFNREGGPLPTADPDHLKKIWSQLHELEAQVSANKTSGLGALAAFGIDPATISQEQVFGVMLRVILLRSMRNRNILGDYLVLNEFTDEVFKAVATLPCNKSDVAEAFVLAKLKELPEEAASKFKAELIAGGYDPQEPKIDAKFLSWMREHGTAA